MQGKGVLCHLTSLPEVSLDGALRFLEWLEANRFDAWQMLPLTPPDEHGSPYASPSAFAAWPKLMQLATPKPMPDDEEWLEDWALYAAIKKAHNGQPWFEWPTPLRDRHPQALENYKDAARIHRKHQQCFQAAWSILSKEAKARNITLIGDVPIFIAHDSADVWAHRELFQLDADGMPLYVAGVPPDYFSENGQKWGTVLYDWNAHEQQDWRWWIQRIERMFRLFDVVRIDHFRGFHSNWAVPASDDDARQGSWQDGPKDELLRVLVSLAPSPNHILAEDLGIIPDEVIQLRQRYGLPGMAVMQFGFDGASENNPHHPATIQDDQVVYTGTHDNNTTVGWWAELNEVTKGNVQALLEPNETPVEGMMRLALQSAAPLAIFPLQDVLQLDGASRMNTPGTSENNWMWTFEWSDLDGVKIVGP
ncbi:MAG: 4-alpha-glucanotransferase [Poseidonia sp.]